MMIVMNNAKTLAVIMKNPAVPPILAFDLRHMAYADKKGNAPIMSAWLGHITRSVQNHFDKQDQLAPNETH
jgi:hypothetical protein